MGADPIQASRIRQDHESDVGPALASSDTAWLASLGYPDAGPDDTANFSESASAAPGLQP
jgi:hypothetical protein